MRRVRILNLFISDFLPVQTRKTLTTCLNCGRFQLTPRLSPVTQTIFFRPYSSSHDPPKLKVTTIPKYSSHINNVRPAEPSIAITKFAIQGRCSEAISVYLKLLQDGGFPSREALYQLIRSLYRSSNLIGLFAIHDTLLTYYSKQTKISNKTSRSMIYLYTMLMNLVAKNTKPIDMNTIHSLCKEMTEFKLSANIVLYNILIKALLEHNQLEQAHAMFDELKANDIQPTIKTYGILMKDASKRKDIKRMLDYLDQIKASYTIELDYAIFSIIVTTLCDLREFDKAIDLVESISLPSIKDKLSTPTYTQQLLKMIESNRKLSKNKKKRKKDKKRIELNTYYHELD